MHCVYMHTRNYGNGVTEAMFRDDVKACVLMQWNKGAILCKYHLTHFKL